MANRFYEPGERRAARVADLFAKIATRYDWINDLQSFGLHRLWKRRLLRLANPQPGEHGLDLCCGTGDIAFALARAGADVVGLDFSGPMLSVAEQRQSKIQNSKFKARRRADTPMGSESHPPSSILHPRFLHGDAMHIPFSDASFDIVAIGYGLRNLASWEAGLREMVRVARPAGRLLVLDFGKPDNAAWRALYFAYLRWFVPVLGKVFCGDAEAYRYILESLKHYPAQRGVADKMREIGCADVRIVNLLGGVMSINYGRKM